MIRAIVWDMGGVLVSEDPPVSRRSWEERLGLDDGELARMVFYHPVALEMFLGKADPGDLWRCMEMELALAPGSLIALRRDFWGEPVNRLRR